MENSYFWWMKKKYEKEQAEKDYRDWRQWKVWKDSLKENKNEKESN